FRDFCRLPGEVEYPPVDVERFASIASRSYTGHRLVIGRHSRDIALKHHPNDPAFYRGLVARGHRLRMLGGTCLRDVFSGDPSLSSIDLLATGAEAPSAFLAGLDCFVYRKHPTFVEAGGTAILEAMATGLPVVVFRDGVGVAELIEHGEDGFV